MHDHVLLLAGHRRDGTPVRESVPAERVGDHSYRILGTPGLTEGCASGDVIELSADGSFTVTERSGNVAIHVLGAIDPGLIHGLRRSFEPLRGIVESPEDFVFAVVTVPIDIGFQAIEAAMAIATDGETAVSWSYANIYDEADQPLNWWVRR